MKISSVDIYKKNIEKLNNNKISRLNIYVVIKLFFKHD